MKKITVLILFIASLAVHGQEAKIDISNEKSECEKQLLKLDSEIDLLLKSIITLTEKGDSTSLKTALDIVNNTIRSKVSEYKLIQQTCLSNISLKVNSDLELISSNITNFEQKVKDKNAQLEDCNKKNNNEVANSLLKELKDLFKNSEEKQILIDKQNTKIDKLKTDSINIWKQFAHIQSDTVVLNKQIVDYKKELKNRDDMIEVYKDQKSLFSIGLAFGPNFDSKGDYTYLVSQDSTIQEKQVGIGANGMVSAVVSFEFKIPFMEKTSQKIFKWTESSKENRPFPGSYKFLLNVPLTETLLQDKENAIGIFNKKVALGLGFGIDVLKLANGKQSLSIFYIANFSPIKKLDVDYYSDYKFKEGYPNKIDLNNYVTYNEFNLTHFVGIYLSLF